MLWSFAIGYRLTWKNNRGISVAIWRWLVVGKERVENQLMNCENIDDQSGMR